MSVGLSDNDTGFGLSGDTDFTTERGGPESDLRRESQDSSREPVTAETSESSRESATEPVARRDDVSTNIPAQSDADGWSDELLQRAAQYGYTTEQIREWGDPESAERVLYEQDRLLMQRMEAQQRATPFQQPQFMPPAPMGQGLPFQQLPPQAQPGFQQPPQPQPNGFQIALNPKDGYDEGLVNQLQAMKSHYDQQLAQMQQVLGMVGGQVVTREQAMMAQQQAAAERAQQQDWSGFDKLIEELGASFQPLFGKGNWQTIQQGTPFGNNRTAVYQEYARMRDWYQQTGRPMPSERRLVELAAETILKDQWAIAKQRAGTSGTRGKTIGRPTNNGSRGGATPEEEAAAWANQFYRERGMEPTSSTRLRQDQIGL